MAAAKRPPSVNEPCWPKRVRAPERAGHPESGTPSSLHVEIRGGETKRGQAPCGGDPRHFRAGECRPLLLLLLLLFFFFCFLSSLRRRASNAWKGERFHSASLVCSADYNNNKNNNYIPAFARNNTRGRCPATYAKMIASRFISAEAGSPPHRPEKKKKKPART